MPKTTKKMMPLSPTFPDDILIEFLHRLPVKSLLRFKCVSKTWRDLISSPRFVKLHLDLSTRIHSKFIFYVQYDDTYTIDYQSEHFDPEPLDYPVNEFFIRGCCNGLLCLSDNENYMSLWNPATREDVVIDYASVEDDSLEDEERDVVVGFGYDPLLEQYKIVRSIFFFRDYQHQELYLCDVKVCTLGTGEWRTIADPPCCLRERHMVPLVGGALHWLGGQPIGSNSVNHKIISFDIRSEEFRVVPWIESVTDTNSDVINTLGALQGCLSVLIGGENRAGIDVIDVWMMKDYGVKESWTKLFSIQMPTADMMFTTLEPLVLADNGEMILKSEAELYVYDGNDHTLTATHQINDYPESCMEGHIYAESLVSIKSLVSPQRDEEESSQE